RAGLAAGGDRLRLPSHSCLPLFAARRSRRVAGGGTCSLRGRRDPCAARSPAALRPVRPWACPATRRPGHLPSAAVPPRPRPGGRQHGVAIHGDTFVSRVDSENDIVTVTTRSGVRIEAKACVVATNTPFTDYANVHTKQAPYRTYVVALTVEPGSVPDAMYFDDGDPYHYCRLIREAGDREL